MGITSLITVAALPLFLCIVINEDLQLCALSWETHTVFAGIRIAMLFFTYFPWVILWSTGEPIVEAAT